MFHAIFITTGVNEDKPKVSGATARRCLVPSSGPMFSDRSIWRARGASSSDISPTSNRTTRSGAIIFVE